MRSAITPIAATAVVTLTGAVCCFVPLLDLLGYEFCFVLGLVAVPTAHLIGLWAGRRAAAARGALLLANALAVLHLLPALLLISLNAVRVRNCDWGQGLAFFLALPLANALWAATLGVGVATFAGERHALRRTLAVLVLLLPLLTSLWLLYAQPPIFAYDHLWGFFSGSLYDEGMALGRTHLWFRLVTAARWAVLVVLVLSWEQRSYLPRRVAAAAVVLLALVAADGRLGAAAGYRIDRDDIERELSVRIERPGLVIHLPADTSPELQHQVALDHEFRLAQLTALLEVEPDPARPVHSYVYATRADKARLMGGDATQVAKPWLREIHIHEPSGAHRVLAHELVHALAADFGDPLFGLSMQGLQINMALVEGLAEGVTLRDGNQDLHTYARAMREVNLAPDVGRLLGGGGIWGGFYAHAPGRAYTVAGSFVRWLIDTRGVAAFKRLYRSGDFAMVYGTSLPALVSAWEERLAAIDILPRDRIEAEDRFQSPSIFEKPCAHVIAQLRDQARRVPAAEAVRLNRDICRHLGDTTTARLGLARALLEAHDDDGYLALTDELLTAPDLNAFRAAELREARGELFWKRGEVAQARSSFAAAAEARTSLGSERMQWVRLWALDHPEPGVAEVLRDFLSQDLPKVAGVLQLERLLQRLPGDPTLLYLIGRQLEQQDARALAREYLEAAAGHPFAPIEAERLRLLGGLYVADHDWEHARQAYNRYRELAPISGEKARADDELARITFLSTRA